MRPFVRVPIELKGIFWGSEMRWFLRGAEVWLGTEYLGDISAEWLADQVAQKITELALSKRFQIEMEPHRLGLSPEPPPLPPAQTARESRRKARASRKGRRKDTGAAA